MIDDIIKGIPLEQLANACDAIREDRFAIFSDGEHAKIMDEWIKAHAEGRLAVLPCKVGDTVYVDTRTFMYGERNGRSHAEGLVTSFAFGHRNFIKFHIFSPYVNQNKVFKYPLSAIGCTVFLTREAAEAALKGESNER